MAKTFRPYEPDQQFLLPPSLREWLPDDHLALWLLEVVRQLDLGPILRHYEGELRGYPPHHPRMMVALLLYAYSVGVPSSRKIERRTHEDIAFRVLSANNHPDHKCISEFRRIHLNALAELFAQVLGLCRRAGLVTLGHVALDGTKMKANASKHKAMSYARMVSDEAALTEKAKALLAEAESVDAAEDAQYGKDRRGDELPEDLRRTEGRAKKIRELLAEVNAEVAAQKAAAAAAATEEAEVEAALAEKRNIEAAHATRARDDDDDAPPPTAPVPEPMPSHRIPTDKSGAPTPKAQRNFTDGDSRIMKTGDGFVQGYNAQTAVDAKAQIIVAHGVSNQPPDVEHLIPMIDRVVENCGRAPERASADSGYFSESNVVRAECRGVDVYLATGRIKHGASEATATEPSDERSAKERMRAKLATDEGRAVYARRKAIAEPPFGQIKNRGFRQFLLRGLDKVRGEWALICTTHNLLKLHAAVAPA